MAKNEGYKNRKRPSSPQDIGDGPYMQQKEEKKKIKALPLQRL